MLLSCLESAGVAANLNGMPSAGYNLLIGITVNTHHITTSWMVKGINQMTTTFSLSSDAGSNNEIKQNTGESSFELTRSDHWALWEFFNIMIVISSVWPECNPEVASCFEVTSWAISRCFWVEDSWSQNESHYSFSFPLLDWHKLTITHHSSAWLLWTLKGTEHREWVPWNGMEWNQNQC